MIYLGCDPDSKGCIAAISGEGKALEFFDLEGTTTADAATFIMKWAALPSKARVILERQQAMPKQGVSSTFKIGQRFGEFRGILAASRLPWVEVRASVWKPAMGLPKGLAPPQAKRASRAKAQELWPDLPLPLVKHHGRAEAFLMAEYGRGKKL